MQNVTKLVALVGLMTLTINKAGSAAVATATPATSLDSISTRAFHICQNVSINISEDALTKQVMVQAKGDWPLLTWLSREKKKLNAMVDRVAAKLKATETIKVTPSDSDNELVHAIVMKTIPLVKQILTDVLHLENTEATAFWQNHGKHIATETETALRSLFSNSDDLQYIKTILEQEHFTKFMHIIASVIKNQLNAASHLKAAVASLRSDIRAAAAA